MAAMLQELEAAKKEAEATRLKMDEELARQLMDEERHLLKNEKESRVEREKFDKERAEQMQEIEKAQRELERMRRGGGETSKTEPKRGASKKGNGPDNSGAEEKIVECP